MLYVSEHDIRHTDMGCVPLIFLLLKSLCLKELTVRRDPFPVSSCRRVLPCYAISSYFNRVKHTFLHTS